jgi:hypothetical protein
MRGLPEGFWTFLGLILCLVAIGIAPLILN